MSRGRMSEHSQIAGLELPVEFKFKESLEYNEKFYNTNTIS